MFRSSHQRRSVRKCVLGNSWKTPVPQTFLNKVAGRRPATLLKKRLWYRCFQVNFVKFLRTPFLQDTSERLLLNVGYYGKSTS